jgi:hypothetical protein
MDILSYSNSLKRYFLEVLGNKDLLKGISVEIIPSIVLVPPEPLKRQTAVMIEEKETFNEMLDRIFWQSRFQRRMIISWLKDHRI